MRTVPSDTTGVLEAPVAGRVRRVLEGVVARSPLEGIDVVAVEPVGEVVVDLVVVDVVVAPSTVTTKVVVMQVPGGSVRQASMVDS